MNYFSIFLIVFLIGFSNDYAAYFSLEGTTGAGKSTLLQILEKKLDTIHVVYESVEPLQDINGHGNLFFMTRKPHVF